MYNHSWHFNECRLRVIFDILYVNLETIKFDSVHCKENSTIYVFLFWKSQGLSPNLQFHVSVSDLYIPGISHIFLCSRIGRPILEICKSLTDI
jgi:hypothetical protein